MEKIISRKNKLLVHGKKLGSSRSYREQCGEFLCEGEKLLDEAIRSAAAIVNIFISSQLDISIPESVNAYMVDKDILKSISPLKNPQDVLFICKIPNQSEIDLNTGTHILLDNIQDPGNVGTIMRSATAFGIDSILLSKDCADIYNPKTIRATMGAIFRQKFKYIDVDTLRISKARIIGTSSDSRLTHINNIDYKDCIIVMGNEGQGISGEILSICTEMTTIPISPSSESLNVAAAASIIMYEVSERKMYYEHE